MASTSSSSTGTLDANVNGTAFDGILPQPLLPNASVSSSSSMPYDVFINHRGPDVKRTLATHIYGRLKCMGLRVFLDEKVFEVGASIPREIQDAIHSALLHIAIFSPNYAESPWCLEELSIMLRTPSKIIPVFYNVDPSDLRWVAQGKGIYAQAFSHHEEKHRYSPEKLQDWKTALYNVSFLYGLQLENNEGEGMLVKSIVNCVLKGMNKVPLEVAQHPVGLEEMVQEVESTLETSHDEQKVKIVGIFGMGGSGKTTLAKEIYNRKCSFYDRSSFVFDVRDGAGTKTLQNLQKKLVEDLLPDRFNEGLSIDNITQGKEILRSCLWRLRVLVVLDDIDHVDQIDALLPSKDIFQPGSLIMITTREVGVLKSRGISCTYKMRGLHPSHAKELFCWHAFLQSDPLQGFEDLAQKFVEACGGLPLSLKVLGGELYDNSKDYWVSLLDKISRIVPLDIQRILKVSFDALDSEEQDIFLDIACFFIGEEKDLAFQVWDGLRLSGLHRWERIFNKCLVELDQQNRIRMHDHLRDMGREIARTKLPYRFFPFSNMEQATLWGTMETCLSAFLSVCQLNRFCLPIHGSMPIRGIMEATTDHRRTNPTATNYRSLLKECMELFSSLVASRLLIVVRNDLTQEFATLTKDLVWLRWFDFEHRHLPRWMSTRNLRVLEILGARHLEELWDENVQQPPLELRMLSIWEGNGFHRFPKSIGRLGYLKKLCLHAYRCPIRELPEEFCDLYSLEHLELRGCLELSSLPGRFGDLTNLRHLNLKGCRRLMMLPVSFKELINLEHIEFDGCENLTFTMENSDILDNMTKLEYLGFLYCRQLLELPGQATNQASLRELYLGRTGLRELPSSAGQLQRLELLTIGSRSLTRLPISLGNLFSLKKLGIFGCDKLKYLPDSLGNLSCLKSLQIFNCRELKSLPAYILQLCHLQEIAISDVPIENLSFGSRSAPSLREISLHLTRVSKISISDECCPNLETLALCRNECLVEIETLPRMVKTLRLNSCKRLKNIRGIEHLPTLLSLWIDGCPELTELPSFAELASIKEIKIEGIPYVGKIEGLEHLRSVETLQVHSHWDVPGITSLKHTERFRRLELLADNIAAHEPCIQSLEHWASEMIICGRGTCDVESLGNALDVPGLIVVEAFPDDNGELRLKSPERHCSNGAAILCCVLNVSNSVFPSDKNYAGYDILYHENAPGGTLSSMKLGDGKWVWIGVFTQGSPLVTASFGHRGRLGCRDPPLKAEKGILATGKERRIKESFRRIYDTLKTTRKEKIEEEIRTSF